MTKPPPEMEGVSSFMKAQNMADVRIQPTIIDSITKLPKEVYVILTMKKDSSFSIWDNAPLMCSEYSTNGVPDTYAVFKDPRVASDYLRACSTLYGRLTFTPTLVRYQVSSVYTLLKDCRESDDNLPIRGLVIINEYQPFNHPQKIEVNRIWLESDVELPNDVKYAGP